MKSAGNFFFDFFFVSSFPSLSNPVPAVRKLAQSLIHTFVFSDTVGERDVTPSSVQTSTGSEQPAAGSMAGLCVVSTEA